MIFPQGHTSSHRFKQASASSEHASVWFLSSENIRSKLHTTKELLLSDKFTRGDINCAVIKCLSKLILFHSKFSIPCSSLLKCTSLVALPVIRRFVVQWIIGIRSRHESLNAYKDGSNLKGGTPFVLQNIQTNAPQSVHIWMINLRQEPDFGRTHRILFWQEELQFVSPVCRFFIWSDLVKRKTRKDLTFIRRISRPRDNYIKVPTIIIMWDRTDSRFWLLSQPLCFLPIGRSHTSIVCCECKNAKNRVNQAIIILYSYVMMRTEMLQCPLKM
jgi:hypothetical protein